MLEGAHDRDMLSLLAGLGWLGIGLQEMEGLTVLLCEWEIKMRSKNIGKLRLTYTKDTASISAAPPRTRSSRWIAFAFPRLPLSFSTC